MVMQEIELKDRLRSFIESGGKSCSMDIGGIIPEYVYRLWDGVVTIEDIEVAMKVIKY